MVFMYDELFNCSNYRKKDQKLKKNLHGLYSWFRQLIHRLILFSWWKNSLKNKYSVSWQSIIFRSILISYIQCNILYICHQYTWVTYDLSNHV